ncbi:class I SAM-dependent methyltransferase [bacterium]|nr:class I SAM-dependent methyltransferase [bacterium]
MKIDKKTHRLYNDLSWLWPIWGSAEDYSSYDEYVHLLYQKYSKSPSKSLLVLTCGQGKNIANLKKYYQITGIDISKAMLDLARESNPECEYICADIRNYHLERQFDLIFIDDGLSYLTKIDDLHQTFQTAFHHLKNGGVLVVSLDTTKELFEQNKTMVEQGKTIIDGEKIDVTFIENDYDPDPEDSKYEGTITYLIRRNGKLTVELDHHILGVFPKATWMEVFTEAGFKVIESNFIENEIEYPTFTLIKPLP